MNSRLPLWLLLGSAAVLTQAPAALAQGPATSSSIEIPSNATLSADDIDRMLSPLGDASIDARRAAVSAVVSLGGDATDAIAQKLADFRRKGDEGRSAAIRGLRDRAKEAGFNLVEALLEQSPEPGVVAALKTACLIRTLGHIGTTPAIRQWVLLASDANGAFRVELTRQVKQLGDRAVAALIEGRRAPVPETRVWATTTLEALGKRTPGDAVQTKDNQALGDVLLAYAITHDLDALPVVLSFVNSDRTQVRLAAREATLAYGQDAVWKLRDAYAALTGDQAPEGMAAADLAKKLFGAYDRYRQQDVYALLDQGLAKQRDGNLEGALADFDQVLARQPLIDRRAEMAGAYLTYGEAQQSKDRASALAFLRKALRLDEAGPQSSRARSDIKYLEGEDLLARGIADTEPFEQALALDPQNAGARAELDRLHAQANTSRVSGLRIAAATLVLVLGMAGVIAFGKKRKAAPA